MDSSKESAGQNQQDPLQSEEKNELDNTNDNIENNMEIIGSSIKESGLLKENENLTNIGESQMIKSEDSTKKHISKSIDLKPKSNKNLCINEDFPRPKLKSKEEGQRQRNAYEEDPISKRYSILFKEIEMEGGLQKNMFDNMIQRKHLPEKKSEVVVVRSQQQLQPSKLSVYELEPYAYKPMKNKVLPPLNMKEKKNEYLSPKKFKKKRKKKLAKTENQENFALLQVNRELELDKPDSSNVQLKRILPEKYQQIKEEKSLQSQNEGIPIEKSHEDKSPQFELSEHDKGSTQQQAREPKAFQIKRGNTIKKTIKENRWKLTPMELASFGNRFPSSYHKTELLGRGGFSLVWRGEHIETKRQYAIKQILKRHPGRSHMKEIFFGNYFFSEGEVKKRYAKHPGVKNLTKMISYIDEEYSDDVWMIYEIVEGLQLSKSLYEIIEIASGDEKTYAVDYKGLYCSLIRDCTQIYKLIFEVAQTISVLSENHIMLCDLKPDNIIVNIQMGEEPGTEMIHSLKLVDYGSCCIYEELKNIKSATPEYMPPEVLYIIIKNFNQDVQDVQKFFNKALEDYPPWAVDIWSLGCIILEILTGVPLWMTRECEFHIDDETFRVAGLFGEKGRPFKTIIKKQIYVLDHLDDFLDKYGNKIQVDEFMIQLIKRMMDIYPKKRISPRELLSLPIFKSS